MEPRRSVRSGWLKMLDERPQRMRRLRAQSLHVAIWLGLGLAIVLGACQTPRATDPPPPCPLPTEDAVWQMDTVEPDLAVWLGRMLRYCEGIDVLRGEP